MRRRVSLCLIHCVKGGDMGTTWLVPWRLPMDITYSVIQYAILANGDVLCIPCTAVVNCRGDNPEQGDNADADVHDSVPRCDQGAAVE